MFRVSFFVDDKNLAPALRVLEGNIYNLEAVPVERDPEKATPSGPRKGSHGRSYMSKGGISPNAAPAILLAILKVKSATGALTAFSSEMILEAEKSDLNKVNARSGIKRMVDLGALVKTGQRGVYSINPEKLTELTNTKA